jgi:alpha-D-ribose 1-methylphosphonate 5-triphosphate synthase subunit PhnH
MPATAFPETVMTSQAVFRAVMGAFSRPGEIKPLRPATAAPTPLSATAAALALALLDHETPVWLDAPLSEHPRVADWIRTQVGARVTSDPQAAAFAFIADPSHAPPFNAFCVGTAEYPDRSTTLVLQVERFGTGERLSLSGPGIANARTFSSDPLPPDFAGWLAVNRALYPRGVDVILVSPAAVATLPRSVSAVPEQR